MKRYIHVVSQFNASINEVTEGLIKGLNLCNFIITREGDDYPLVYDILLCHFINPVITQNIEFEKFRHKVLIQPIDGTSIEENIVDEINKFDLIITPGNAGKEIMIKNGVIKPIEVIPNYFTLEDLFYTPENKKLLKEVGDKFMFYHESTCHPRKGVREMVRAYVDTFSSDYSEPNTILVLKCPPHNNATFDELEKLKEEIIKLQSQYKYPAKVIKISQWLTKQQLNQLMDRCDCYIQPSKIEGFGIPLLRAILYNKQVIALNNPLSGYMDYILFSNAHLVSGEIEQAIGEINPIYKKDTQWMTPDIEDLSFKMFLASTRHEELKHKIYNENKDNSFLQNYLFDNVIKKYAEVLNSDLLSNKERVLCSSLKLNETCVKYYLPRGNSGYSQAAKDYVIGLSKQIPVTVEYLIFDQTDYQTGEKNKIVNSLNNKEINYNKVIIHSIPEHWGEIILKEKGKNPNVEIIGMTVWETDKLDPRWVDWINEADKVIVPCTWNKEVFEKCGIIKPIEIVPHIYNPIRPSKAYIKEINEDDFVFYTIGQWSNRKGIDDVIKAYLNEFTENDKVCLVIKTFGSNYSTVEKKIIKNKVNSIIKQYANPAKIILLLDEMTDEEINSLHSLGHCYVSLAKAEGFGLGMFDAAANNIPVISTGYGGQLDFVQSTLLVDYDLIPVEGMKWIPWYNNTQNWAQPKLNHASELMRLIFNKKDKEQIYAKINASKLQLDFSSIRVINNLIKFLKQ